MKRLFNSVFNTFAYSLVISFFVISGILVFRYIVAEELGLISKDINIVGTGSMYPTWPKGTKGKTQKELADEIVSTAGFLPYPNGLTISGYNLFGHVLARGDIIAWENEQTRELTSSNGTEPAGLLKRIIGLSGDKIELRDGIVYLNGQPQKEAYTAKPRSTFGESFLKECQEIIVPKDFVFAMGDNRKGSADSREIGYVPVVDITKVLPYKKQIGQVDSNWRDPSYDLDDSVKPKVDRDRFVKLLNILRKEQGVTELKYNSLLEKSAFLRGEFILKSGDFKQEKYTMEKSMADAGYWNSYWWEVPIQGYYEADELIEDYLERDWSEAKQYWFDAKFDDIGIAEVEGSLNGCPTQILVIHVAGYIPATYEKNVVESWKSAVLNLTSSISSWENIVGKKLVDENELSNLISLLYKQKEIAEMILSKMEKRQWLTDGDRTLIENFNKFNEESNRIANQLNDI